MQQAPIVASTGDSNVVDGYEIDRLSATFPTRGEPGHQYAGGGRVAPQPTEIPIPSRMFWMPCVPEDEVRGDRAFVEKLRGEDQRVYAEWRAEQEARRKADEHVQVMNKQILNSVLAASDDKHAHRGGQSPAGGAPAAGSRTPPRGRSSTPPRQFTRDRAGLAPTLQEQREMSQKWDPIPLGRFCEDCGQKQTSLTAQVHERSCPRFQLGTDTQAAPTDDDGRREFNAAWQNSANIASVGVGSDGTAAAGVGVSREVSPAPSQASTAPLLDPREQRRLERDSEYARSRGVQTPQEFDCHGMFFNSEAHDAWCDLVETADQKIDILAFRWTSEKLTDCIVERKRVVPDLRVRICLDRKSFEDEAARGEPFTSRCVERLIAAGVKIRVATGFTINGRTGHMHCKLIMVDECKLISGSNNPTWASHNLNREFAIRYTPYKPSKSACRPARREFRLIWNSGRVTRSCTQHLDDILLDIDDASDRDGDASEVSATTASVASSVSRGSSLVNAEAAVCPPVGRPAPGQPAAQGGGIFHRPGRRLSCDWECATPECNKCDSAQNEQDSWEAIQHANARADLPERVVRAGDAIEIHLPEDLRLPEHVADIQAAFDAGLNRQTDMKSKQIDKMNGDAKFWDKIMSLKKGKKIYQALQELEKFMSFHFESTARNISRTTGNSLYRWVFDSGMYYWSLYVTLTKKEQAQFTWVPIVIPNVLKGVEDEMRDLLLKVIPADAGKKFIGIRDRKPIGRNQLELPYLFAWMLIQVYDGQQDDIDALKDEVAKVKKSYPYQDVKIELESLLDSIRLLNHFGLEPYELNKAKIHIQDIIRGASDKCWKYGQAAEKLAEGHKINTTRFTWDDILQYIAALVESTVILEEERVDFKQTKVASISANIAQNTKFDFRPERAKGSGKQWCTNYTRQYGCGYGLKCNRYHDKKGIPAGAACKICGAWSGPGGHLSEECPRPGGHKHDKTAWANNGEKPHPNEKVGDGKPRDGKGAKGGGKGGKSGGKGKGGKDGKRGGKTSGGSPAKAAGAGDANAAASKSDDKGLEPSAKQLKKEENIKKQKEIKDTADKKKADKKAKHEELVDKQKKAKDAKLVAAADAQAASAQAAAMYPGFNPYATFAAHPVATYNASAARAKQQAAHAQLAARAAAASGVGPPIRGVPPGYPPPYGGPWHGGFMFRVQDAAKVNHDPGTSSPVVPEEARPLSESRGAQVPDLPADALRAFGLSGQPSPEVRVMYGAIWDTGAGGHLRFGRDEDNGRLVQDTSVIGVGGINLEAHRTLDDAGEILVPDAEGRPQEFLVSGRESISSGAVSHFWDKKLCVLGIDLDEDQLERIRGIYMEQPNKVIHMDLSNDVPVIPPDEYHRLVRPAVGLAPAPAYRAQQAEDVVDPRPLLVNASSSPLGGIDLVLLPGELAYAVLPPPQLQAVQEFAEARLEDLVDEFADLPGLGGPSSVSTFDDGDYDENDSDHASVLGNRPDVYEDPSSFAALQNAATCHPVALHADGTIDRGTPAWCARVVRNVYNGEIVFEACGYTLHSPAVSGEPLIMLRQDTELIRPPPPPRCEYRFPDGRQCQNIARAVSYARHGRWLCNYHMPPRNDLEIQRTPFGFATSPADFNAQFVFTNAGGDVHRAYECVHCNRLRPRDVSDAVLEWTRTDSEAVELGAANPFMFEDWRHWQQMRPCLTIRMILKDGIVQPSMKFNLVTAVHRDQILVDRAVTFQPAGADPVPAMVGDGRGRGRGRGRAKPKPKAKTNAKGEGRGRGRPRTEWYGDEGETWMMFDTLELRDHILSGHRTKRHDCPGCIWARETQGWKYKGTSTVKYAIWERPIAADARGPYRSAGFDPLHARLLWFALALDTGEGFVIGLKDKSDESYEVAIGELECEANLDQPQIPDVPEEELEDESDFIYAGWDPTVPRFKHRYVLKHDKETVFNVSLRLRARVSRGGGRIHFGVPKQGVPISEAWVRQGSELVDANMASSMLAERHRLIVAKTTMMQRNFDLGWEHRVNRVVHLVEMGALCTVVLSPKQRKLMVIPKSSPRALLACIIGCDWETTTGVYIEIPVERKSTRKKDKGQVYRNVMVTSVNFFSVNQFAEKCHGWKRRGSVMFRAVWRGREEEPDAPDPQPPALDWQPDFNDDWLGDRWGVGDGVSDGPEVPAAKYFGKWTLEAPRSFVKGDFHDVMPDGSLDDDGAPSVGARDSALGVESRANDAGDGP